MSVGAAINAAPTLTPNLALTGARSTGAMKFVITGGGTGGHVYPALALADEARRRGIHVLYVGTERGLEARAVPAAGVRFATVSAAGVVGRSAWRKLVGVIEIARGVVQALALLRQERADLVIGVGGYVTIPIVAAAWLLRVPRVLCEQNVQPGTANAYLAKVAHACAATFPETVREFPGRRVEVTGNPVRRSFREAVAEGDSTGERGDATRTDHDSLLVFGGSQGARSVNQAMIEALPLLKPRMGKLKITHQTGSHDLDWVREEYEHAGVRAQIVPYIDEMARACREASVVVCRAGASSIAELSVIGAPAILIPYPHSAHGHQEANARSFAAHGGAMMILDAELNGSRLAAAIAELLDDPQRRETMSACSRALGRPDAAERILDLCQSLLGGETDDAGRPENAGGREG